MEGGEGLGKANSWNKLRHVWTPTRGGHLFSDVACWPTISSLGRYLPHHFPATLQHRFTSCYSPPHPSPLFPTLSVWLTHTYGRTHTHIPSNPRPTPTSPFSHLTTCQGMFMGHCLQCWWSLSLVDSITHSPLMDGAYPDVHWYGCPWPLGQTQWAEGAVGRRIGSFIIFIFFPCFTQRMYLLSSFIKVVDLQVEGSF